MKTNYYCRQHLEGTSKGFTLIELMSVMAIMAALIVVGTWSLKGPSESLILRSEAERLAGQMQVAKMYSLSLAKRVQFRFYRTASNFDSFQAFKTEYKPAGGGTIGVSYVPLTPLFRLDQRVVISSNASLSPLMQSSKLKSGTDNGKYYLYFEYKPDGTIDLQDGNLVLTFLPYIRAQATSFNTSELPNFSSLLIKAEQGKAIILLP